MRHPLYLFRLTLAALLVAALASVAVAQTGRVGGTVKDESGQPLKGATVTAENPNASPSSFTATTDDKGRFSIIGLRTGTWTFTAQAPGFAPESGKMPVQTIGAPNPPLTFTLRKGGGPPPSALGGLAAKDLQGELAVADQAYNAKQWDDAVQKYQAIMAKAPALSVINLQIAQAYRNKADDLKRQDPKADVKPTLDQAIAAYEALLKADPKNDKAMIGIGMTNLEKGDLAAAETTLKKAAEGANPTREVFYNLGEVKFSNGQTGEAATWYQKAVDLDGTWGKPLFKLALVELNKLGQAKESEKEEANKRVIAAFEKVIVAEPMSQEAAQAKAVIEQLKK